MGIEVGDDFERTYAVSIAVLISIFVGSLIVLILICRRTKLYHSKNKCNINNDNSHFDNIRADINLINVNGFELDEVGLETEGCGDWIERILTTNDDIKWMDDASGLVPHCIAILKTCHTLTERLTQLALVPFNKSHQQLNITNDMIDVARKISIRVDDVVRAMLYPPLDARLLEARAVALTAAVTHLVLIVKFNTPRLSFINQIQQQLYQLDKHLIVLREAALSQETFCQ